MEQKKMPISWNLITEYVDELAEKIKASEKKYDALYAIPRGGLVIGVMLSHRLDLPLTMSLDDVFLCKRLKKEVLLIDEMTDSGSTIQRYDFHCDVAVLFKRHSSLVEPTYYVETIENDNYIVYPWEI